MYLLYCSEMYGPGKTWVISFKEPVYVFGVVVRQSASW